MLFYQSIIFIKYIYKESNVNQKSALRCAQMKSFTDDDRRFMSRALELARAVKGATFPNPAVGAVVVAGGRVVGEGATAACGGPHAEKTALLRAGSKARGASLYVTLEPCCHFGKTPPCTDAIIEAGIRRVVVAVSDPNPLVEGKGIRRLRSSNITVDTGLMRNDAVHINEDFFWAIKRRRAFITLKLALTLDGMIADCKGNSKWITAAPLRRIVHDLRRIHAAVAVGSGTLITDNPRLTVRYGRKSNPARIIFTSDETIPQWTHFYRNAASTRGIVVVRKKTKRKIITDTASGIEFWYTGSNDSAESMVAFTEMAFEQNITSVLVEGGRKIASVLLGAGLVNRLYLFYGNKIFGGGTEGISLNPPLSIDKCIMLRNRKTVVIGNDFYITGLPAYSSHIKSKWNS